MKNLQSKPWSRWLSLSALLVSAQVTACASSQEDIDDVDGTPATGSESGAAVPESSDAIPEATSTELVLAQDVKVDRATMASVMTEAGARVPTVEVTAAGELVELDDAALRARGIGTPYLGPKVLADGPIMVASKTCVDVESGEHVCPDTHPNHRICPTDGLPKTANCVTSNELPLVGQQSWCCQ